MHTNKLKSYSTNYIYDVIHRKIYRKNIGQLQSTDFIWNSGANLRKFSYW